MHFRKYLMEEGVYLDEEFQSLEEVLRYLSVKFAAASEIPEEKIYRLLYEREQLSSTWVGNGTMLPHNHSP